MILRLLSFIFIFFSLSASSRDESKISQKISLEDTSAFRSSLYFESQENRSLVMNGEALIFDSYLTLVRENHPNIIQAELSKDIAKYKRIESQGAFDPSINSKSSFNRFNSSSEIGEEQESFISDTSLDFLTGYGAKFGLGAKFAEGDIKTPISPVGDAGEYYLKAQIPLLRGAIYNSKFIKEKQSKLEELIADYILYRIKLGTLLEASNTYWDWIATANILKIENELLDLINGQVSFVKEQSQLGNLAAIDLVEAKRELQKRQVKVNTAERKFQELSLKLSKFLWQKEGIPYSIPLANQVPDSISQPTSLETQSLDNVKFEALKKRPEFKALDLSRDINDLERKLAKNQMLPLLDLFLSSGFQAGDDSVNPSLIAGLDISVPLRIRSASGRKNQAELEIRKLNIQERQLIQNVFLEIEDSYSELKIAYDRYLAAKQDFELSKELEQGERTRFELGDSTLFLLIRRQRAAVEANIELIRTIRDYFRAKARLQLVTGDLI
jgi:hypothetical protein